MKQKQIFPIVGMHCAACKNLLEQTVQTLPGVNQASVNFATEKLTIEYDNQKLDFANIRKAVQSVGRYDLLEEANIKPANNERLGLRVILVGLATVPFALMMLGLLPTEMLSMNYWQFFLATLVLFWGGGQIFQSAFSAFKAKTANMDTLISIGTLSAWSYSTVVTFWPKLIHNPMASAMVYYEAAVFIMFFMLLGRFLEQKAKKQASQAIAALFKLQAKNARVIRQGQEMMIPLTSVVVGDILKVKPGEKIPVDGVLLEGHTAINEAMITGESLPVEKQPHDTVIGATLNTNGTFTYRAEKVGQETLLSQIIKLVEEAQATQAPVQRLADQVSKVFVPTVIIIALVTFSVWFIFATFSQAIYAAITVLIIACPCALGLATPIAVMVGSGLAAKRGILIKDAQALELSHRINTVVFDKTGTLTWGKPQVINYQITNSKLNELVCLAEAQSHHPLAEAVTIYLHDKVKLKPIKVNRFQDFPGLGIEAQIGKDKVLIGTEKLLLKQKIELNSSWQKTTRQWQQLGQTVSYVAVNNKVAGLIGIADTLKPEATTMIKQLKQQKLKTVLLTGDNRLVAQTMAKAVGIDEVRAQLLPQAKAQVVRSLQNENGKRQIVAMVGDGINDAPALAASDIGIAMGTGTDVAANTGDIVLVKGTLHKVNEAINISKRTYQIIKQNLFWAFAYNIIGIPVAAGVLYPFTGLLLSPIMASMAMAMSSVSVVLNSLRLRR